MIKVSINTKKHKRLSCVNACIIFSHSIQHFHYLVQEKSEFSLKWDDLEQLFYVKHR